jgi:hypothetical protein
MRVSMTEVFRRADEFFMGKSPIHRAAANLSRALTELSIPFAIAGAMAANSHGHTRTTQDVDVLLTPDGLRRFKERWLGRGWVELFPGSKGVRDAAEGVKIDVLLTGDYPGDGKPKPVCFPDPVEAAEIRSEGWPVLSLKLLLQLKLASGMTAPHRLQDLADVIELVRANKLGLDYAEGLDPYVREKYTELWHAAQVEEEY